MYIPGTGYWFDINFNQMQKDMRNTFSERNFLLIRQAGKDAAYETGLVVAYRAKDIVAEHSKTGRLAASLGPYDPDYLTGEDSESDESDSYFEQETRGNVYYIKIGSSVPYAEPVLSGFSMTERRVVYIPEEDRFITVQPFTYGGIHALEEAWAMTLGSPDITVISNKSFAKFEASWNRGK